MAVNVSDALRAALRWDQEELDELADDFLDHKVFTYVETLVELAEQHGFDLPPGDLELSDAILTAIGREAVQHARYVADTFNRDLDGWIERNAATAPDLNAFLDAYQAWAEDRGEARAEIIAITEAYPAAADATLAFYAANGEGDNAYNFGGAGHGGDHAECVVCETLIRTNPHPHARVLEIGSPHINCPHTWHREEGTMRDEFTLPSEPAGILGTDPIVNRFDNDHQAAADALEQLVAAG